MISAFPEEYYANCNAVFRRLTDQNELMLEEMQAFCRDRERLSILSVGSGVGLFEIPMLRLLIGSGIEVSNFVGLDVSAYACAILAEELHAAFGTNLTYRVFHQSFQEFTTENSFDLLLYNHVFEYLGGQALAWIRKSRSLLSPGGSLLIFSPNRGGINRIYDQVMQESTGSSPFFSDDIERLLVREDIDFFKKVLHAECDISPLLEPDDPREKIDLLSFLTQRDCRSVPREVRDAYVSYYLSLRPRGSQRMIPHPTTLFIL